MIHPGVLFKYFKLSLFLALLGAIAAFLVGYYYRGSISGGLKLLFVAVVLGVLEVSLSFDNAIVNATILRKMTRIWQRRFLTWGILIAVFGMRLIFPLILVSVVAHINPWNALVIATTNPAQYAKLMLAAHTSIAAFGGSFLLLVALKYFFDRKKNIYWIEIIEKPLSALGRLETAKIAITLIILYLFSLRQPDSFKDDFLIAGIWGTVVFMLVDGVGSLLQPGKENDSVNNPYRASLAYFIYLELLDASFSFDGVVGAFAITNNLFIIMIGLGVGAMFVRSLTIMLVEKHLVQEYRFLEHGAFYAIGILSLIMFLGTIQHVPEILTGSIGISLILLSVLSSIHFNKKRSM